MKKTFCQILVILLLCLPVFAVEVTTTETRTVLDMTGRQESVVVVSSQPSAINRTSNTFDLGFTFGHGALSFNEYTGPGLSMTLGITMGMTKRLELDIVSIIELVPYPFSDVVVGAELSYALLGERSFGDNRAGIGINTYLSAGLLFSDHTPNGMYAPTYLTLSVTPVSVGSPYSGRRERLGKMGVAWNFMDNSFSMYWNIALFDWYVLGTWRDYR